jgi:inner membrane transporter RhtA
MQLSSVIVQAVLHAHATLSRTADAVPPQLWSLVRAVFHYLGPSFAVLLFARVDVLGVAWFRIASAAVVFALWTRPWRVFAAASRRTLVLFLSLGACLTTMNSVFYLAIAGLPLSLVATIEFVAAIAVALFGLRSAPNYSALGLAARGVFVLTDLRWESDPLGLAYAVINGLLFIAYIVLGHRIAGDGADEGVGRLGAAMAAAFLFVIPIGFAQAAPHWATRCSSWPASASASARPSSRMSRTSSPWRVCPATALRSCWRCCRRSPP